MLSLACVSQSLATKEKMRGLPSPSQSQTPPFHPFIAEEWTLESTSILGGARYDCAYACLDNGRQDADVLTLAPLNIYG